MKQFELKIPPLVLCAVFAGAIVAIGLLAKSSNVPFPGHQALAVLTLLLGCLVAGAGVFQFHRKKTSVNPMSPSRASAIVTSGVFRVSRNPMYLGMALVLLGLGTWHASIPGWFLVVFFCRYMTVFQIKPEERILLTRFGDVYEQYMGKVRRWV